jgi:hypothetical protein
VAGDYGKYGHGLAEVWGEGDIKICNRGICYRLAQFCMGGQICPAIIGGFCVAVDTHRI